MHNISSAAEGTANHLGPSAGGGGGNVVRVCVLIRPIP